MQMPYKLVNMMIVIQFVSQHGCSIRIADMALCVSSDLCRKNLRVGGN